MAILAEDVSRVRQASDLVDIAGEHIALKRVGMRWMGICPFHAENSPSFSINGEEGLFYCFGCQKKGDVITFVREIDHLDFVQAVERLAGRNGIELRYDNSAANKDHKRRALLTSAMEKAVDWYHQRLLNAADASPARAYLRERGYTGEIVREFRIGWAPDGWDELAKALRLPENILKETGLGFVNRRGRPQDAFRARILFPIFDVSGNPVAFGGRNMPGADGPKYKNSSETTLYSKSRTLYALNWAKADVVNKGEILVCEGYTDVIGFFQADVPRAVATCGTALTEDHVRQLKNFATRIVLAYDSDGAGQEAAARFYEWERKLGIDIFVAAFPKGSDPADVARKNPDRLREIVATAQPYLQFRLERALAAADLRSVEGRARGAETCLAMVAEHPNEFVRDSYLMLIADRCHVAVERLRGLLSGGKVKAIDLRAKRIVDVRRSAGEGVPEVEWEALRVAVHQPGDVVRWLEVVSPPGGLAGIEEMLFDDERARGAFRALTDAPTLQDAIDNADPESSDLLSRLAVQEARDADAAEEFGRLIDRAANRAIRELEVQARVSPEGFADIGPSLGWLKLTVEQLRRPETSTDAAAGLIGWLMEQMVASA